jgi:hypothetical protein
VAPVLLSASIYAVLSVYIHHDRRISSLIPRQWILWTFVTSDVIATGIQIAGAALIGVAESKKKDPTTAKNILLGGLVFQSSSFLIFTILLTVILSQNRRIMFSECSMIRFWLAFSLTTLLVYLRTIFRMIETADGVHGFLFSHEAFFGCLEFLPIVLSVYLWNIFHPGKYTVARKSSTEESHEPE